MYFQQLGRHLTEARKDKGLTQEALAKAVGLSRTTVNQMENGVFPDLGARKLLALLSAVGLDLEVKPKPKSGKDYLKLACTSANVSYKESLLPDELARALLAGKAPAARRPQLRVVFDELPDPVFDGLLAQVEPWAKPGRVRRNVERLAVALDSRRAHRS